MAGTAALVRGLRPDLSQEAVYELIRRTADDVGEPGLDLDTGWGRLNAYRAVSDAIIGLRLDLVADPPTVRAGGRPPCRCASPRHPARRRARVPEPRLQPAGAHSPR